MSVYKEEFDIKNPDRLHYATGVFLDADDMLVEQTYHRGRLTRVLAHLHGMGTASGLEVSHDRTGDNDKIVVSAGLAVDRLGRLIEVPREACLDLNKWFTHQQNAVRNPDSFEGEAKFLQALAADASAVIADVYVRFAVCPRGRTPAFASGPFDAIDAAVPHRLRDSYQLSLELRGGESAPLPSNDWPVLTDPAQRADWIEDMKQEVLDSWAKANRSPDQVNTDPPPSAIGVDDSTAVFLARVRIPVTVPAATAEVPNPPPERDLEPDGNPSLAVIDNFSRQFVYPNAALLQWIEASRVLPTP